MGLQQKWKANSDVLKEPAEPLPPRSHPNPRSQEIASTTEIVELRDKLADAERQREEAAQLAKDSESKLAEARERQVQLIDPRLARPSRLMNRHESTFATEAYRELVESVRAAGGNEQPAMVRRLADDPEHPFEIIAGLRRHRAAIETGTPLKITIEEADDSRAYDIMSRENSQRADLSPWEWGKHYLEGLAIKKCKQKELAASVGMSEAHVNQALPIGMLPDEVVNAFPSPLDIQFAWGKPLTKALDVARERVLKRAAELAAERAAAAEAGTAADSARDVFRKLTEVARRGRPKSAPETSAKPRAIHVGKVKGLLASRGGKTTLELRTTLPPEKLDRLEAFVKDLLR